MTEAPPSQPIAQARRGSLLIFAAITLIVFCLDLGTKHLAFHHLAYGENYRVIRGLLSFQINHNAGAVFGIGQGRRTFLITFTAIAAAAIIWAARRHGPYSRLLNIGLACLLGGALGNLYDRIRFGHVRDFIDLYAGTGGPRWPTFNVADIAICVGAGAIILHAFLHPEARTTPPAPPQAR